MTEAAARFVIDSNILSRILRKDQRVAGRLEEAVQANAEIYMCPVVYFEVLRGLLYREATRQLRDFEEFVARFQWIDFLRPIWHDAAASHANSRRRGRPHDNDADLLIAACARHLGATLVTNNTADFVDLDVGLVDWVA